LAGNAISSSSGIHTQVFSSKVDMIVWLGVVANPQRATTSLLDDDLARNSHVFCGIPEGIPDE